jgi:hypothetical protein
MILDTQNDLAGALTPQAEEILFQMAEGLGLLVTEDEAAALTKLSESAPLNEMQNIVRLNRQSKLNSLQVRSALVLAQQRKDSLFTQYARAAMLKRKFRAAIVKKYGSQAQMTARKLLANAGKRNLVDVSSTKTFGHPENRV